MVCKRNECKGERVRAMAWRIHDSLIRGEVDSRAKGRVTGRLWVAGRAAPLTLELEGNPLRDMAGCLLTFERRTAGAVAIPEALHEVQRGFVGDMTASRKVRVLAVSPDEAHALRQAGRPVPEHRANALYLEWYSERNGRVVLESADCKIVLSEPVWHMGAQEEQEQVEANTGAMRRFLERVSGLASAEDRRAEIDSERAVPEFLEDDETPMDEFGWERFLRDSDERTEAYGRILEKYADMSPEDAERLAAREMGWTHIEEYLESGEQAETREHANEDKDEDVDVEPDRFADADESWEMEPNPETEGRDWIRDKDGRVHHPLQSRATEIGFAFRHDCLALGLLGEPRNDELEDLVFSLHMIAVKLAGALNSLAYESDPDNGFIVAYLKRALKPLHDALRQSERIRASRLVPDGRLDRLDRDVLSVREEILRLMRRYRAPEL